MLLPLKAEVFSQYNKKNHDMFGNEKNCDWDRVIDS